MIGLLDLDWFYSSTNKELIPNLEIIKLAAYYKLEENIFCRLIRPDETDLSSYDRIYVYNETASSPQLSEAFSRANNVIYGGTAYTNGIYVPFNESLIDFTLPRLDIYKEFLKEKYQAGVKTEVINRFLDSAYYRCYAGTEFLPIPPMRKNKRIYLYDHEFFYDGWQDVLNKINSRKPSSIMRIHPIVCTTLIQYFELRKFPNVSRANSVILDLNIPLEEVDYMFKEYKNLFLADIVQNSNVFIPIGDSLKTNMQYFRDLIYKLNLLYCFWSRNIPIKIMYIPPRIGFNNPLSNLEKTIETWAKVNMGKIPINKKIIRKTVHTKMEDERNFLLKFYPSAQDLFEQTYEQVKKMGRWRV